MTPDDEQRIRRNAEDSWEISVTYRHDAMLLLSEIDRLRQWIADLQSGMYINCVYCGHRYGRAVMLKQHIAKCPEHPMSALLGVVKEAQRQACQNLCPTVWKSTESESRPHCEFCKTLSAAIKKAEAEP